jgi:hypothetical protein
VLELVVLMMKVGNPITFVLAFVLVFCCRTKNAVFVAAVALAVALETVLVFLQPWRTWGHGFVSGVAASFIQLAVAWAIVAFLRKRGRSRAGVGQLSAVRAVQPPGHADMALDRTSSQARTGFWAREAHETGH